MYKRQDLTGATGSYRFMAPEVALSKPYGRPVDVYSFAMILYNVYDSVAPWYGETGKAAAKHAIRGERPPIPRDWDSKIGELLRLCWAHEPFERPSFAAVLDLFDLSYNKIKAVCKLHAKLDDKEDAFDETLEALFDGASKGMNCDRVRGELGLPKKGRGGAA